MTKITLTGAPGVGKTVLSARLANTLKLPLIEEIARLVCTEKGYKWPGDIANQQEFKLEVLERQIAEEKKHQNFVADRSVIDGWVLWQRWNLCSAMTYDTEAIYNKVKAHVQNYTHIVYLPPMFPASEDDFRWTEPDYIRQIDRLTKMTLYDLKLWDRTYTINSADESARVIELTQWLAGLTTGTENEED